MPDYDMNTEVPHEPRTLIEKGFFGMFHETNPPTAYEKEGLGSPPGQLTSPLENRVNPSSNSTPLDLGPTAHEITERGNP